MSRYTMNMESAKQGDSVLARITESGRYVGTITRAEEVTSTQGTTGIELSFKSDDGSTADFLSIWTFNKDGKELFGLKQLNALMTCLRIRTMAPQQGKVEKYDSEKKARVTMPAMIFPDLMDKRIGFLLQREEYLKRDNTVGDKLNIFAVFDPSNGMMATEILDRATKAERLNKIEPLLKDKLLPASTRQPATEDFETSYPRSHEQQTPTFADLGDDIPW